MSCSSNGRGKYDFPCITRGDTLFAINFATTGFSYGVSRVIVDFTLSGATSPALTLDSTTSGVTINSGAAGNLDFTVGPITDETTATLTAGVYASAIRVYLDIDEDAVAIDADDARLTVATGTWKIN